MSAPSVDRMNPLEVRASLGLASLYGLRMLGLFMILPVFPLHAESLPGGQNHLLVGLAMGIYGLTQGLLQIPFGAASDVLGRKRVIVFGLALFAVGSFVAAFATDIHTAIIGRALQGAGAVSAAVTAFLADLTREQHRTKAMAGIGGSIAFSFALSLVAAPVLYQHIGMGGIFSLTGMLAIGGILVTLFFLPAEPREREPGTEPLPWKRALPEVLRNADILRLNFGIFALHAMQMALFVVVPLELANRAGLMPGDHWKVYLPAVMVSFALMIPPIMSAERGRFRQMLLGSVLAMLLVLGGFALQPSGILVLGALLLLFFTALNILEALLPAMVSRVAPKQVRGLALGVYNTTQSFGLFVGGVAGGALMQGYGPLGVFTFAAFLMLAWFLIALPTRVPPPRVSEVAGGVR